MPELPEVETIKRDLQPLLTGKTIKTLVITDKTVLGNKSDGTIPSVTGRRITKITRRGKFLLFSLTPGENVLCIHLGMTGRLIFNRFNNGHTGHDSQRNRATIVFSDSSTLGFADTRRFGKIRLLDKTQKAALQNGLLGMEPLARDCTLARFLDKLKDRRVPIHAILLDQKILAGIGNIYAAEALHRAKISPERITAELGLNEAAGLLKSVKDVLRQGIKMRGSSVKDYVDAHGNRGLMQNHLKVYGRKVCPGRQCAGPLTRLVIRGRGVMYCPKCQK